MLTTHQAKTADLPALKTLAREHYAHFHRLDQRLPDDVNMPSWMLLNPSGACWLARDNGRLCGALAVEPEYWAEDSPLANVFPRDYLRMRLFINDLCDPATLVDALLERVDGWLAAISVTSRMIMLPSCDDAFNAVLSHAAFEPYHIISHQALPWQGVPEPASGVTVRHANDADVDSIAAIMAESWEFHAKYQPAIEISRQLLASCQRQARQMLGDGYNQTTFVAVYEGQIVGFYAVGITVQDVTGHPPLFATGYYGEIYEVGVRGNVRRGGIGSAMTAAAMRWFAVRGATGALVNFAPTNPTSSRFWPKLGFADAWFNWYRT